MVLVAFRTRGSLRTCPCLRPTYDSPVDISAIQCGQGSPPHTFKHYVLYGKETNVLGEDKQFRQRTCCFTVMTTISPRVRHTRSYLLDCFLSNDWCRQIEKCLFDVIYRRGTLVKSSQWQGRRSLEAGGTGQRQPCRSPPGSLCRSRLTPPPPPQFIVSSHKVVTIDSFHIV